MFRFAWGRYEACLARRPVLTKCITRGACYFVGDLWSQVLISRTSSVTSDSSVSRDGSKDRKMHDQTVDSRRLVAYSFWGGAYAPFQHYFFNWLESATASYGRVTAAILRSVANTCGAVPLTMYPSFYFTTGLIRGKSGTDCAEHMRETFLSVYTSDLVFWIPTECVIFFYVPLRHQVLAMSTANTIWAVILSTLAK
eukprot:TRINITY_DN82148_c0_g1_i1.p1 TRINITY_DN82148_c0_g1~~TRINITY_DN82148_c0_g1_i1.p1  ORF type:complete len:197 (+),score=8.13 TRINITY_DN82148_c0_g1_i1:77-667(+)